MCPSALQAANPEGSSIPLPTLLRHYHAVVFAYGASQDRTLGISRRVLGRRLLGARVCRLVQWTPRPGGLGPGPTRGEEAVIVGQGNVALDVARMLLEDVDVLRKTDIAEHALEVLSRSRVKRVHVVGRRGPMQVSQASPPPIVDNFFRMGSDLCRRHFTIKEVRELMKLSAVGASSIRYIAGPARF